MEQMSTLIEEKELYRRKDIRITDLATELATNKTYVSLLLNNMSGESFTSMITRYRVQYAQRLMQEHPDMLLEDVASESGFSPPTSPSTATSRPSPARHPRKGKNQANCLAFSVAPRGIEPRFKV